MTPVQASTVTEQLPGDAMPGATVPGGAVAADQLGAPDAADQPDAPDSTGARPRRALPFCAILGLVAGIAVATSAKDALRDVDLYWHLLAGAQLAQGTPPSQLGLTWSFAPAALPWTSTQWLSELALHQFHHVGGWTALVAFRVVTTAIVVAILAWTTLRGRPAAAAAIPFATAAIAAAGTAQERPQQFTFIGAAALGGVMWTALTQGRLPRWWLAAPLTMLWANLHGGWVLAPAAMGLVWFGRLLDRGPADRVAWRALGLGALLGACGLVSPAGLGNLTAVLRFSSAAEAISEWQRTVPLQDVGLCTLPMLVVLAVGWSRSSAVPRSEVVVSLALLLFSWTAWRNTVPALLMLAPFAAGRLDAALPGLRGRAEPRWSAPLGAALAVLVSALALLSLPGRDVLPRADYPLGLIGRIAELPPGQRVLNDYNVAGMVLYFGGPGTKVAVDGRSDRYGAQYINSLVKMTALRGDWQGLLAELRPTAALLEADSALAHVLVTERGWTSLGQESDFVLLVAPDA